MFQPVSDELTNNILPLAIESVDKISEAFQTDGISGAIGAFGEVLSDGLAMVVDYAPMLLDAGMRLLGALGEGLLANLPALADGAMEIISVLADGIMDALPMLTQAVKKNRLNGIKDLLYADVRQDGTVYISPKKGKCFTEKLAISGGGNW